MRQLNPWLTIDQFVESFDPMTKEGYKLFGLTNGCRLVSAAGFRILSTHGYGRILWLHVLVTNEKDRGKGYAEELLEFIEGYAARQECTTLRVYSSLERTVAHRFYEKLGYRRFGVVFEKILKETVTDLP